ncbi:hypothetical protein F383_15419 [Gossypium arboreum]|uniref:Uncharacterized protein n=1 Tax=Gossypium arboreum TaxID=29729 RepID=A0A0B0PPL4_GOSAR|nr:hypothetical protein F383_15419 [Gossypium arboreum]
MEHLPNPLSIFINLYHKLWISKHDGWPLHVKWEVCHANPPILHSYLFGHFNLAYSIFKHFHIGPIS